MTDRLVRIGHTPDADDAFMFFALSSGKVAVPGVRVEHVVEDIETLNRKSADGELEITALSFAAYPYVAERYDLMACGASMGDGCGPLVVSRRPMALDGLRRATVGIPGEKTSAALLLRLWAGPVRTKVFPFTELPAAVKSGAVDAAVLIHEGQLLYKKEGLEKVEDLGAWWKREHGLAVPLGGNAIRKDLPPDVKAALTKGLSDSIRYALEHRDEALPFAMKYGRGMTDAQGAEFVGRYVNGYTVDLGEAGWRSVRLFLKLGSGKGFIPKVAV